MIEFNNYDFGYCAPTALYYIQDNCESEYIDFDTRAETDAMFKIFVEMLRDCI